VEAIAEVLFAFAAFEVVFARLDRFPGALWLAPEPAQPFARMIEALMGRFPDYPPYGGAFNEIVPHLTVAQSGFDEAVSTLEPWLPLSTRAERAVSGARRLTGAPLVRTSSYLTHEVFNTYRSETAMMRYLKRLADYDYALDRGMIPLGSCTMKLNAATEMEAVSWPEYAGLHPFAPADDVAGARRGDARLAARREERVAVGAGSRSAG